MSVQDLTDYEYANKRLRYEPETGNLYWRHCDKSDFDTATAYGIAKSRSFGRQAGALDLSSGYYRVTLLGKKYLCHRVAWLLFTGSWPEHEIDHINGDPLDNRIDNLRDVEHKVNVKNASRRSDNKTGFVGVFWDERSKRYKAYVRVNKKLKHLGSFVGIDQAIAARAHAEIKYGFHQNHGR